MAGLTGETAVGEEARHRRQPADKDESRRLDVYLTGSVAT
jgi:hypothetical protein